ncbi:hypothetical protein Tco_0645708 [Tanacetum coccineum]
MFDESLNPPTNVDLQAPEVIAPIPEAVAPEHAISTGSPSSTTVDQDAPSPTMQEELYEFERLEVGDSGKNKARIGRSVVFAKRRVIDFEESFDVRISPNDFSKGSVVPTLVIRLEKARNIYWYKSMSMILSLLITPELLIIR